MRFLTICLLILSLFGFSYEMTREKCHNDYDVCGTRCNKINNINVRINCFKNCSEKFYSCLDKCLQ